MKFILFFIALAAQAQINVGVLDQIGTSLPASCSVGQRYTKTDATAAAVIYVCTATNTWTQQTGTGSSSIPDEGLRVSAASGAARLSTGSRRIGSTQYTLSALCDVTPTAGTGNILYWMTNTGTFSAGHNVTATVTSGSCTIAGSTTSFPVSTMPLGYCAVTSGTLGACVNVAQSGRDSISGSAGITVTGDAPQAISANVAELGVVVSVTGAGTATRTCTVPTGALVATCYISSLDANVTTYNLNGLVNGQRITSRICRDGTATRTMAWPSNMLGFLDPIQIASGCTIQSGTVIASNLVADNAATFVDSGATGVAAASYRATGATPGLLELYESSPGTNHVDIVAPGSLGATTQYTWPDTPPAGSNTTFTCGAPVANVSICTFAAGGGGVTYAASATWTANGAANTPAAKWTGTVFNGGTGTSTMPAFLLQPSDATAATTWDTSGTLFGLNGHQASLSKLFDFRVDGVSYFYMTQYGSVAAAGQLNANALVAGKFGVDYTSTFTISGCSTSTLVGGSTAGKFTSGTTGACTVTITMGNSQTAANGWSCWANNLTTAYSAIGDVPRQTGGSTTTAVISMTTASGDVIDFGCVSY